MEPICILSSCPVAPDKPVPYIPVAADGIPIFPLLLLFLIVLALAFFGHMHHKARHPEAPPQQHHVTHSTRRSAPRKR